VIELAAKFVATTDDVSRLQRGDDPECTFFQEMANYGHFGGRPGATRQGIYICCPSGKFLASINHNSPERVLQMMQDGLAAWQEVSSEDRKLADESEINPRHRWEDSYPSDGLVIHVLTRDLPEQCTPDAPCESKWNQDYAWFSSSEAREWLGLNPQVGDVHSLPESVTARLAQFHLVDSVKGETPEFTPGDVAESHITTEVIERTGSTVRLLIVGQTQGVAGEGWWQSANGVVARLYGHATFVLRDDDLEQGAFTELDIVALGRRWGHTRFNGRERDLSTGPLGYVLRLASPDAPRIAPTHIDSYSADWVENP
jgi:hypothetical protein